jgi:hypothetical protein
MTEEPNPKRIADLLVEFKNNPEASLCGTKIPFDPPQKKDVYNITAPFSSNGIAYIAGRTESRISDFQNHHDEEILFFYKQNDRWIPDKNTPVLYLEDPFVSIIHKKLIIGGVLVYQTTIGVSFKTVFYQGNTLFDLQQFAEGPEAMKDIRLVELSNGLIGVFTRPVLQKGKKEVRKIGFVAIHDLDELKPETLKTVPILEKIFDDDEWGGVNEAHLLPNGTIGILGHIANKDKNKNLHYYAISFVFNPQNFETTPLKIIATRNNFPVGEAKRSDLKDVIFSGGLVPNTKDKTMADLYVGLSDAEAGVITIPNPFL